MYIKAHACKSAAVAKLQQEMCFKPMFCMIHQFYIQWVCIYYGVYDINGLWKPCYWRMTRFSLIEDSNLPHYASQHFSKSVLSRSNTLLAHALFLNCNLKKKLQIQVICHYSIVGFLTYMSILEMWKLYWPWRRRYFPLMIMSLSREHVKKKKKTENQGPGILTSTLYYFWT